ncbi:hypothetical protein P6B95_37120 [Streptomyces atratus]|uniref:hypothetical protein n=1 Tax=Streptomyces atratus TaxID=1893 RepID=UPI00166F7133|nr:hypothetical protein [Streptomyces atratus]WPW32448.1 hypothetical protein P6B95_37120 [Streptomyces atratus]GGT38631.1 hypothetical protein GCM10010207_43520 [Streptomyces atratus]
MSTQDELLRIEGVRKTKVRELGTARREIVEFAVQQPLLRADGGVCPGRGEGGRSRGRRNWADAVQNAVRAAAGMKVDSMVKVPVQGSHREECCRLLPNSA